MTPQMKAMIVSVATAIDSTQMFFRFNNWTQDRVPGKPIEICRYGTDGEDEIVVVARFAGGAKDGEGKFYEYCAEQDAFAAARALLVHLRDNALPYNVRQKLEEVGKDADIGFDPWGSGPGWLDEGEAEKIFRAGIEALLEELGK